MPLSSTKLKRPPLASDYVARGRLLAHLEWWRERPLTLVSTPAGYGKSTLLSAWLEETEAASGWLSLETRDDSLHALASGMVQAIEGATQHSLPRTRSWLQETNLAEPNYPSGLSSQTLTSGPSASITVDATEVAVVFEFAATGASPLYISRRSRKPDIACCGAGCDGDRFSCDGDCFPISLGYCRRMSQMKPD